MKILMTSVVDLKKSYNNRPQQFIKFLSRKHRIDVVSINDWWKDRQKAIVRPDTAMEKILEKVEYHHLTERKISPFLQELLFRGRVKRVVREDVDVHLNYNSLIVGYAASNGLKTVFDLADDLIAMIRFSSQIPSILKPLGRSIGSRYLRRNIAKASKITLTTPVLKESIDLPEEKTTIIPNGVDTTIFKNHRNAKEELGFNGFVLGYVGALREWVDFEPVFRALKALDKEVILLIVGKEGRFNENIALAHECGVSDRVIFTGPIGYSEVPKYIGAMDVCLIPFKSNAIAYSALPLKLFEYMACEKPVISAGIPSVKAVADDTILYASSETEYVDRIRTLYEDKKLRMRLGRNGRKIVEENYDWNRVLVKLENVLYETVGDK